MIKYLCNAFSLGMLAEPAYTLQIAELSADEARELIVADNSDCQSAVGHADTAALFAALLRVDVPMRRVSVALGVGDIVIVGQLSGPRLPEGATTLPDGASIKWLVVEVRATY